jgi:hypothetical protein
MSEQSKKEPDTKALTTENCAFVSKKTLAGEKIIKIKIKKK